MAKFSIFINVTTIDTLHSGIERLRKKRGGKPFWKTKRSQKVLKFGSADLIKFIEIHRGHGCLWGTENVNFKNRDARNAALAAFEQEFGVPGFEPKEITNKIKNLRTRYHRERKKIKDSMGTDSLESVLLMFTRKSYEHTKTPNTVRMSALRPTTKLEVVDGLLSP
uniref:MADF domain-containing protein n=1 Tax=Rhodnius prolixus TaxID=13249 RepID=T1IE57_RHOPR